MNWPRGATPVVLSLAGLLAMVLLLGFSETLNPIDAILGRGATVTVPDVEGAPLPRARATLEDRDLVPELTPAFSLSVPQGSVIAQDPPAGTKLRVGDTVVVIVSRGAHRIAMPTMINEPFRDFEVTFEDAGIVVDLQRQDHEAIPEGHVIDQQPAPGVMVTGEDNVVVVVSAGPTIRTVPETEGLSPHGAGHQLGRAGILVAESRFTHHDSISLGAVVRTIPPAGTQVERDSDVILEISAGPEPQEVPSIVGQTEEAARRALRDRGFAVVVTSDFVGSNGPRIGSVTAQSPEPGTMHNPSMPLTIVVARDAPPQLPPAPTTTTTASTTTTTTTTTVPADPDDDDD